MVLTTVDEQQAPEKAKELLSRSQKEVSPEEGHVIIDVVVTIISYRFGQISRQEVERMLDITFEETRVYQEIKAEGEASVILCLLRKRFGELPEGIPASISTLKLTALDELSEALLDFSDISEVESWLASYSS